MSLVWIFVGVDSSLVNQLRFLYKHFPLNGFVPQVDLSKLLPELIAGLPHTDCSDAALGEVALYVKRSQYITIPEEWWGVFP